MPRILLVEDDMPLQQAIRDVLTAEQYESRTCSNAEEAVYQATTGSYDLILLDVMLPDLDGYHVALAIRQEKILTPIIMLTARDRVDDRVRGLDSGADDYLVKPFAFTELIARIRAHLRRTASDYHESETLELPDLKYWVLTRELCIGREVLVMSSKEAALVELFMRYPNIILTRQQLIDRLWGADSDVLDNTLEAHISRLRKRLLAAGGPDIVAVRGLGYRLDSRPQ